MHYKINTNLPARKSGKKNIFPVFDFIYSSIPHIVRSGEREQNAYNKRMRTQSEHRLCPQRGGQLTSLTVNIKHS